MAKKKSELQKVQTTQKGNSHSLIIAPSILSSNLAFLRSEIQSVEQAGADWIHVDVMDGSFVPPITFGANVVETVRQHSKLFVDTHLMIVNPEKHISVFKTAGAQRLTVHQEACVHLHRVLAAIKEAGMSAGVCINPGTPVEAVYDVLEICDLVLVMTVNPGWGGQEFIPSCLIKIEKLKREIQKRNCCVHIQVDGGIAPNTAAVCVKAGANVLVSGSYVFGSKDRRKAINSLRK